MTQPTSRLTDQQKLRILAGWDPSEAEQPDYVKPAKPKDWNKGLLERIRKHCQAQHVSTPHVHSPPRPRHRASNTCAMCGGWCEHQICIDCYQKWQENDARQRQHNVQHSGRKA